MHWITFGSLTHPDAFSEGRQSGGETSPLCVFSAVLSCVLFRHQQKDGRLLVKVRDVVARKIGFPSGSGLRADGFGR